jgi:hypothetical protein
LRPVGRGGTPSVTINGRPAPAAEVASLKGLDRLEIVILSRPAPLTHAAGCL